MILVLWKILSFPKIFLRNSQYLIKSANVNGGTPRTEVRLGSFERLTSKLLKYQILVSPFQDFTKFSIFAEACFRVFARRLWALLRVQTKTNALRSCSLKTKIQVKIYFNHFSTNKYGFEQEKVVKNCFTKKIAFPSLKKPKKSHIKSPKSTWLSVWNGKTFRPKNFFVL